MKKELLRVRTGLKEDIKVQFDMPTIDINQQVSAVTGKIEAATKQLGEMEKIVEGKEKWDTGVKNTHQLLNSNKEILDKISDLEERSRHSNIRIYGVPERRGAPLCFHMWKTSFRRNWGTS